MQPSEHTSGPTKRRRAPRFRRVELAAVSDHRARPRSRGGGGGTASSRVPTSTTSFRRSPQQLRRRLKLLFHAGYLARPKVEVASAMLYLSHRARRRLGCRAAGNRSIAPSPTTIKLAQLSHTLDITDFMVSVEAACRRSAYLSFEPFADILSRSPSATRTESTPDKWKVDIKHRGHLQLPPPTRRHLRNLPPGGRPRGRSRARVSTSFSKVTRGTMAIERRELYQSSILRKYLSYAESFRAGFTAHALL